MEVDRIMKAIILAAGRGTRMKNLTDEKPKCLIEIKGKPLLDWQKSALNDAGVSEIAIVTGYKREMLQSHGMKEFHNPDWFKTQMVASLMYATEWLQQDDCIVTYSDIFYTEEAIKSLVKCDSNICITYDKNWADLWRLRFEDPLSDAESFRVDDFGYLMDIGGKAGSIDEIQGQYMGLLKFTPNGWDILRRAFRYLPKDTQESIHMTHILKDIITRHGAQIRCVEYSGKWAEFDTQDDLEAEKKIC